MLLDADPARAFLPYPPVEVSHAPSGPLSGLTFAVKDLFDVTGHPTGGGSPHVLAASGIKTRHAPIVQKLLTPGPASSARPIRTNWPFRSTARTPISARP